MSKAYEAALDKEIEASEPETNSAVVIPERLRKHYEEVRKKKFVIGKVKHKGLTRG